MRTAIADGGDGDELNFVKAPRVFSKYGFFVCILEVMIFPSTFVYLPLVENADAAYICARAYNDWAYDYCSADQKRLYPAAVLPVQNVDYAIEELRRVAKRGFKSALVRPIIAQGKYPTFPEFDPLWREFEELNMPAFGRQRISKASASAFKPGSPLRRCGHAVF